MNITYEQELLGYVDDIRKLKSIVNDQYIQEELANIKNRLLDQEFKVAIVGEFSAGKSTFINAIIGKDLLKHASVETTATITYIHNATKQHPNYGKCIIEFMDGTKKAYENLEGIQQWTTTASGEYNVSEQIAGVHLYRQFLDHEIPLVLVDTPGLNGVADNHRELTINEVKKAHACIYLLQLRGLSASDVEFVKYLAKHQNKFIFVQNFIDELHISEGETVQAKLDEVIRILDAQMNKEKDFIYDLCGISALKALAAQDKDITKLYSSDYRELTTEDRKQLWKESEFQGFKAILERQLDVKSLRQLQCNAACHGMLNILNEIDRRLKEEQEESKEMMMLDNSKEIMDKCQSLLMKLQKEQDKNRDKINNFILAQQSEINKLMKNLLQERLEEIENDFTAEINKQTDYDTFDQAIKSKYYINRLNTAIDKLHKEMMGATDNCLEQLSNNALLRVKEYIGTYQSSIGKLNLSHTTLNESDFNKLDIHTKKNEIEKLKQQENELAHELDKEQVKISELERKHKQNIDAENNQKTEMQRAEADYQASLRKLGTEPKAERKCTYETREKKSSGFWGKLKDVFWKSTEEVPVYYDDNSNVVAWENKRRNINNDFIREKDRIQKSIDTFKKRQMDFKNQEQAAQGNASSIKMRLERVEKSIRDKQEELELFKTRLKKEYLNARKQQLKQDIRRYLLESTNNKSAVNVLGEYTQKDIKRNVNKIQIRVMEDFNRTLKKKEKELNEKINGNRSELETRYANYEDEIKQIHTIRKSVEGAMK